MDKAMLSILCELCAFARKEADLDSRRGAEGAERIFHEDFVNG